MPPFINTQCPNCNKPNRIDLSELKLETGSKVAKEYTLVCGHCGRKYKISVKAYLTGDGAIAQGNGATAVGAGGISIEGESVTGRDAFAGNRLAGDSSTDAPPPVAKKKPKKT
jgi:hypothetical protein